MGSRKVDVIHGPPAPSYPAAQVTFAVGNSNRWSRACFDRSAGSPYLVPQHYLMVSNGYLTAPEGGDRWRWRAVMWKRAGDLGLSLAGCAQCGEVTSQYTDPDTGLTHLYFEQTFNQLPVENTSLTVT